MDKPSLPSVPHALFFNPPIFSNYIGHIMAEIYKDKVYAPFVEGKSGLTIVDIGANVGLTAYYFSHFGKVFAVEPAAEHFAILETMIKFNRLDDKIIPVQKAIYIREGEFGFYHNQNKTMFSLHGAVADQSLPIEKVQAIPLDKLFEENEIEHCDLMKLDVEGSEVEILASEGFGKVAPKIDTILVEVHAWNGRHPNQIKDALENNGFDIKPVPNDATLLVGTKTIKAIEAVKK